MKVLGLIIAALLLACIMSVPATWLLMLFLGNLGVHLSFWGALPGGLLITAFLDNGTVKSSNN